MISREKNHHLAYPEGYSHTNTTPLYFPSIIGFDQRLKDSLTIRLCWTKKAIERNEFIKKALICPTFSFTISSDPLKMKTSIISKDKFPNAPVTTISR